MGQNNRVNRKAKKRRLLKSNKVIKAVNAKDQVNYKAFVPLLAMTLKVANGNESRAKYFFDMSFRFLRDEVGVRDFVFLEAESPGMEEFFDMLIFMRQMKHRMLEGKIRFDERDFMEIEEVLEKSENEWRACAVV